MNHLPLPRAAVTRGVAVAVGLGTLLTLVLPADASGKAARHGTLSKHTLPASANYPSRDYFQYVPATLPPAGKRTLVVYLHGCTQTAEQALKGVRWNELADSRHFVVVYPDQRIPSGAADATDGSPAGCWNSGNGAVSARGTGELGSVAQITQVVARHYAVDSRRIYVAGISGGAMMASALAVVYPDLYAAVGHVANCAYLCADAMGALSYQRMGSYARVVPVIDIQGSADDVVTMGLEEESVQQWLSTDDWADDGQLNGSVSRVPSSLENRGLGAPSPRVPGELCLRDFPRNPCPGGLLGSYPVTIRHYTSASGHELLQAWTIHGLMHNYSGGSTSGSFTDPYGPDITSALYAFFDEHPQGGKP
ncbi:MAG: alpha/beta hydrolase-fold protein [Actinomycetota bacterium]|nr:alpha/beta hydrolase-fold protein [Actinomycetota bacterium]